MNTNVLAFTMNDFSLARKIAEIAMDSSKVIFTLHATRRMRERRILLTQILECLRKGRVSESAHQNIHGCWQCTLEKHVSGDIIKVVAALDKNSHGEIVVVITVMH